MLFIGLDRDSLGIVGSTWRLGIKPKGDNPIRVHGGLYLNEFDRAETEKKTTIAEVKQTITKRKIIGHLYGSLVINIVGSGIIAWMTSPWVMVGPVIFCAIIYDLGRFSSRERDDD